MKDPAKDIFASRSENPKAKRLDALKSFRLHSGSS